MQSRLTSAVYVLSFVLVSAAFAVSQEIGEKPPADDSSSLNNENDPSRGHKVTFEISQEGMPLKLFRADPELLAQRYVAVVEMETPFMAGYALRTAGLFASNGRLVIPKTLLERAYYGRDLLVGSFANPSYRTRGTAFFRQLVEQVGHDGGTADTAVDFLLSNDVDDGYVQFTKVLLSKPNTEEVLQFRILAPSQELAQDRAEALVQLLERAIAEPIRNHLRDELKATQEAIETLESRSSQLNDAVARLGKRLDDSVDIEREELNQLKAQRRLLDVELAGLRARIDTAEGILQQFLAKRENGVRIQPRRIDQLEEIKITAEIDLAGLAARREKLAAVIDEGMKRTALVAEIRTKRGELNAIERQLERTNRTRESYNEASSDFSRLFAVKDGKVKIAPINWTE